ncbi:MAG: hypothetical protein QW733_01830 [Desulfurococcaceae archaeon]
MVAFISPLKRRGFPLLLLTLTEKEILLIERLFSTVREYVKITIASGMRDIACPTVGPTGSYAPTRGSSSLH